MRTNRFKTLRVMVVITLILLTIQYELGMVVNLSPDLPENPPLGFSLITILDALHLAGPLALAHAGLGSFLALLSVLILILSLKVKIKGVKLFGSLGFLTIILATISGVLFTLSGFQADHFSLAMGSNFILAFISYFLELYLLKVDSQTPKK
jgi:hypothetical protein